MFKKSVLALAITLALGNQAGATGSKTPKPVPPPSSSPSSSESAAIAELRAELRNTQAQIAASRATSNSRSASDSTSSATSGDATSNNSVDVEGDSSSFKSRALALSLPGLVAAPAVPGQCLEHHAGWGIASAGKTGFTRFAEACIKQIQCLARADRYFAWGEKDLALAQLAACDGIDTEVVRARIEVRNEGVTQDQLDKAKEDLREEMNTKLNKLHKFNMGK